MKITVAAIVALGAAATWFAFRCTDQAVTVDHQASQLSAYSGATEILTTLLTDLPQGATVQDARALLERKYPGQLVKVHADTLDTGGVLVVFGSNGRITRVSVLGR